MRNGRHKRIYRRGNQAQGVKRGVNHCFVALFLALVFGEHPRFVGGEIGIDRVAGLEDFVAQFGHEFQRAFAVLVNPRESAGDVVQKRFVFRVQRRGGRNFAAKILGYHFQNAHLQVADVVGKQFVSLFQKVDAYLRISGQGHRVAEVETQRFNAHQIHNLIRVDNVAQRLGHLNPAFAEPVAVHNQVFRRLDAQSFQHNRPVDGVSL